MKTDLIDLFWMIISRRRVEIGTLSTLIGSKFFCFRNFYRRQSIKSQKAVLEGQSRLESTLEVVELMKLQQDVKILKNVLLTKHQQKLMALQRLRTITFNDTSDNNDD